MSKSYQPFTWGDVVPLDMLRVKDGSHWQATAVVGGRITIRSTTDGATREAEPDPAAPVEILRPVAAEPEPEWLHAAPARVYATSSVTVTGDGHTPAAALARAGTAERLVAELDALAMTTAVALVQLRLSASVLSEHTDGEPVIVEPAGGMPVERLRAHLLAYHGVNEDLNETTTARWVQWHDERMHVNGSTARVPHVHRPA